jgi:hypothetical protein
MSTDGCIVAWTGKLRAPIAPSLRQNAGGSRDIDSTPGAGMKVHIFFARAVPIP